MSEVSLAPPAPGGYILLQAEYSIVSETSKTFQKLQLQLARGQLSLEEFAARLAERPAPPVQLGRVGKVQAAPVPRAPQAAEGPPAAPTVPPEASAAYRRMREELETILSPAAAGGALDGALARVGVAPADATPFDLRCILVDELRDHLVRVLEGARLEEALAALEAALVDMHRPQRTRRTRRTSASIPSPA